MKTQCETGDNRTQSRSNGGAGLMRTVCFADFWTSELHQQEKNQELVSGQDHSRIYLYINPVTMAESSSEDLDQSSVSKPDPTPSQSVASSLQNGEPQHAVGPEVKGPTRSTPIQDTKYKRPPPRPPSLGSGSGMGLLFSSAPSPHASSSVAPAAKRKEEGRGVVGEKEKSASISPPPSRPPVPPQGRSAPPLPPAPLCRASSRKSSSRDAGDGKEREKGQNPATKTEREAGGEEQTGSKAGPQGEAAEQDNGTHEEEVKRGEKGAKEEEKQEDDKDKSSQAKRPSRPVPPPRKKPGISDSPGGPAQPGGAGGGGGAAAGMRGPPPSPARRPDVSLYSPQGGAVIGTDLDSGSNSSTEEEGEHNQELEQNHK